MKSSHVRGAVGASLLVSVVTLVGCPPAAVPPVPPGSPGVPSPPAVAPATPATPAKPSSSPDPSAAGAISGHVTVAAPPPAPAAPNPVPAGCPNPMAQDQILLGSHGELADAIVYLRGDLPKWQPDKGTAFVVDQVGCRYSPHVLGVPVGVPVTFKNSDGVLHNVKWSASLNPSSNFPVPAGGSADFTFTTPELIPIGCSVHSFMGGMVAVLENRFFAVTGADGAYSIAGVPPGNYTLIVVHPVLKKAVRAGTPVTVTASGTAMIDVHFD